MLATKTTAATISDANEISVILDVATAHCAIASTAVAGRVCKTTEKAVCIETASGRKVWFPRRALVSGCEIGTHKMFHVAKWFTPDNGHWSAATSSTLAA